MTSICDHLASLGGKLLELIEYWILDDPIEDPAGLIRALYYFQLIRFDKLETQNAIWHLGGLRDRGVGCMTYAALSIITGAQHIVWDISDDSSVGRFYLQPANGDPNDRRVEVLRAIYGHEDYFSIQILGKDGKDLGRVVWPFAEAITLTAPRLESDTLQAAFMQSVVTYVTTDFLKWDFQESYIRYWEWMKKFSAVGPDEPDDWIQKKIQKDQETPGFREEFSRQYGEILPLLEATPNWPGSTEVPNLPRSKAGELVADATAKELKLRNLGACADLKIEDLDDDEDPQDPEE